MTTIPQAVEQGECTECGESEENYTVENRGLGDSGAGYKASCECGATSTIAITEDGMVGDDNISHEGASWSQSESEESDE